MSTLDAKGFFLKPQTHGNLTRKTTSRLKNCFILKATCSAFPNIARGQNTKMHTITVSGLVKPHANEQMCYGIFSLTNYFTVYTGEQNFYSPIYTVTGTRDNPLLACSRRSDSGARGKIQRAKKRGKTRGGWGRGRGERLCSFFQ